MTFTAQNTITIFSSTAFYSVQLHVITNYVISYHIISYHWQLPSFQQGLIIQSGTGRRLHNLFKSSALTQSRRLEEVLLVSDADEDQWLVTDVTGLPSTP